MKRDGKDVEGRKWIKGRGGRIGFSQEDRCKISKEHMERIMTEENRAVVSRDMSRSRNNLETLFFKVSVSKV